MPYLNTQQKGSWNSGDFETHWDHGKLFINWNRITGKPAHQEKVLLEALKKLCTVGPFGDGRFVVHNVPPVAAIYPPKPPKPMPKRLLERVAGWFKKLF